MSPQAPDHVPKRTGASIDVSELCKTCNDEVSREFSAISQEYHLSIRLTADCRLLARPLTN